MVPRAPFGYLKQQAIKFTHWALCDNSSRSRCLAAGSVSAALVWLRTTNSVVVQIIMTRKFLPGASVTAEWGEFARAKPKSICAIFCSRIHLHIMNSVRWQQNRCEILWHFKMNKIALQKKLLFLSVVVSTTFICWIISCFDGSQPDIRLSTSCKCFNTQSWYLYLVVLYL